MGYKYIL